MRLDPILRAHGYLQVQRPPQLWEPQTEDEPFLALLGEVIAAALSPGVPLGALTLAAANVEVMRADAGEQSAPEAGEYVALTVRGPVDFGPDQTWRPAGPSRDGILGRLDRRLERAEARFAYVRAAPHGSLTVLFCRVGSR